MSGGYFLRRAAHAAGLLIAVSAGTFLLAELAPGDYFAALQADPRVDAASIAALRARYGLDKGPVERYAAWVLGAARGDLGVSIAYNMPVGELLAPRLGRTMELAGAAWGLSWAVALGLALAGAVRPGGWADRVGDWAGAAMLAAPEVLLAAVLVMVAARTGWMRLGGFGLALGALVPGAVPVLLKHARGAMGEAARAPYVAAARARGMGGARLWAVYIVPAAANPMISLFGMSFAGVLSGTLVVEALTGWPGVGPLFLEAIGARDFDVIAAVGLLAAAVLAAGNLAADAMLYAVDARIRRPW